MRVCSYIAAACLTFAMLAADAPSFTGDWRLNAQKSTWGHKPKPTNVIVKIEGADPDFRYSGTITGANGDQTSFHVACPVDGNEHPVTTSYGAGRMTIRRVNAHTAVSTFRSDDGKYQETATTTISPDSRELTRRMESKAPDGSATWVEVYERQ